MTDLIPTQGRQLAKTTSEICTPGLWRRLTDESVPWADACARLAADQAARSELAVVVGDLQAAIEPCGAEFVIETLAPMLAIYGLGRKSASEAEAFWAAYIDTLEGVPREALSKGVREYNSAASSEFFPKPGPLKAICDRHAVPLRMAANRARKALG